MFDYNQIIQNQQRQRDLARKASANEPEGWTHPVPNVLDRLFAAFKPTNPQVKQTHHVRRSTPHFAK